MDSMTSWIESPTAKPAPPFFLMTSAPEPLVRVKSSLATLGFQPGNLSSGKPAAVALDKIGTMLSPCSPRITALTCVADLAARAEAAGAALLCFPEGFLQGYLTDEAAARRHALDLGSSAFAAVLARLPKSGPTIVMGLIERDDGRLFNTAIVAHRGALIGRYRKAHLLGSERIFYAGSDSRLFEAAGLRFGINICHDTNFPEAARKVADLGASLIVCPANNMLRRQTAEAFKDRHNAVRGERFAPGTTRAHDESDDFVRRSLTRYYQ